MEQEIRARLTESGEYATMRAMIVDAALQVLAKPTADHPAVFAPKETLKRTRATTEGMLAFSAVLDFLDYLGLQHTANVLSLEAALSDTAVNAQAELLSGASLAQRLHVTGPVALIDLVQRAMQAPAVGTTPAPSADVQTSAITHEAPPPVVSATVGGGTTAPAVPATPEAAVADESPTTHTLARVPTNTPVVATTTTTTTGVEPAAPTAQDAQSGKDTTYFISTWTERSFERLNAVAGQQVQLEYLTRCNVMVLDAIDSMTVDDCEGGELIVAACEGSVFLRNCKHMRVHVACKQLRLRDCEGLDLRLFTTTDPVIEMSHHISFRPFHLCLPHLSERFAEARLDPKCNRFVHVYDFTADVASVPQPHFAVFYPEHGVHLETRHAQPPHDNDPTDCPDEVRALLEGRLLPAASSETGVNKSYNIKTGAAVWAGAAVAAAVPHPPGRSAASSTSSATTDATTASSATPSSASVTRDESDEEDTADEKGGDERDEAVTKAQVGKAMPPSAGQKGRPPAAPTAAALASGAARDDEYSSFDDSEEDSVSHDKYDVDEDDDVF